MTEVIQFQRHWQRRGTAALWASVNPVLSSGEYGVNTDSNQVKLGDGVTAWNALPYMEARFVGIATGVDTITTTLPYAPVLYTGQMIQLVAAGANTGGITVNINGTGPIPVKTSGNVTLAAGVVRAAGQVMLLAYVATGGGRWELLNPYVAAGGGGGGATPATTLIQREQLAAAAGAFPTFNVDLDADQTIVIDYAIFSSAAMTLDMRFNGDNVTANYWQQYESYNGSGTGYHVQQQSCFVAYTPGATCLITGTCTITGGPATGALDYPMFHAHSASWWGNQEDQSTTGIWLNGANLTTINFTGAFNARSWINVFRRKA